MSLDSRIVELQKIAYGDKPASSEPAHSNGIAWDLLSGIGNAGRQHVDGVRQMAGADVDLSYRQNHTTSEKIGHFIGSAGVFLGSTLLAKRIPFVGKLADGKVASIMTGGLLGTTMPLQEGQSGSNRIWNGLLGAGTMGVMEYGPSALGRLPGIRSLGEKTFAGGVARVGLANGLAGAGNTEAMSLMNTGNHASLGDLALGTATWAVMGTAMHTAGTKFQQYQINRAAAKEWEATLPWQYKEVQNINAADLRPGQPLAAGHYNITYESQGAARAFNLYVSEGAAQTQGANAPLVTFLHGLTPKGTSPKIIRELEYNRLADQDGAIVAYLHARDGRHGPLTGNVQNWNDKNFGYTKRDHTYNDQIAFQDMMTVIGQHVPTANTSNFAISGFSLGGKLANRLAATRSDVSTLATLHGTIDRFDEQIMAAALNRRPIDALVIHGTNDRVLPLDGGRSVFIALLENAGLSRPRRQTEFWAQSNGSGNPLTTESANYVRRDFRAADGLHRVTEFIERNGPHAINGAQPKHNAIQFLMGRPLPASIFDARERSWTFMIDSIKRHLETAQGTKVSAGA